MVTVWVEQLITTTGTSILTVFNKNKRKKQSIYDNF